MIKFSFAFLAPLVIWLATAVGAPAQQLTLAWDPSASSNVTYRLYCDTNPLVETNLAPAVVKVNAGTNLTASFTDFTNRFWFFRVTAVSTTNSAESLPSNQVAVEIPWPPSQLRTVVVEGTLNLPGGWTNLGFFRLRIP